MINQAVIIEKVAEELTLAYMAAGRNAPEGNLLIVAGSLAENIPFQSVDQVHAVFSRAKDIEPIPTQKALKEAFKNYGEEYLKYSPGKSSTKAIGYRDPRAAWLPASDVMRRVNIQTAIKNYCDALGGDASYNYIKVHRTKRERSGDRTIVEWDNPDEVSAFDDPIKTYIRYLYDKYLRSTAIYKGFPADAKLDLGMIPPSIDEFRTMLKAEGQI